MEELGGSHHNGGHMKVACNHCTRTARALRDDLIAAGWCRVVITSPMRRTFTGCPDHARDAARAAFAAIDAEHERTRGVF